MIYVEMAGRCGNQIFHYACARAIQEAVKDEQLILNFSKVFAQNNPEWRDYLKDFKTVPYEYYNKSGSVLINETGILQKILCGLKGIQIKATASKSRQEKADGAQFLQSALNRGGILDKGGSTENSTSSRKKTYRIWNM